MGPSNVVKNKNEVIWGSLLSLIITENQYLEEMFPQQFENDIMDINE